MVTIIKIILEMIGLSTVIWLGWIVVSEYKNVRNEQKEKDNGYPSG